MKASAVAALFGALLFVSCSACPWSTSHACVQEEAPTRCTAVQVCAEDPGEPCGDTYCSYPYTCVTSQRTECANFAAIKANCDPKRVCKEVVKPCGDGACSYNQDCVKETVCHVPSYGRKLLDDDEEGAYAEANAQAVAYAAGDEGDDEDDGDYVAYGDYGEDIYLVAPAKGCPGDCHDDNIVCEDKYTCVARDPCEAVIVQKCVPSTYTPGYDLCHGGYHFTWATISGGEICGDDYCGAGYECADVIVQQCETPCGADTCAYGFECIADEEDPECEQYAYLATICQEVYEPVCALLSPYCLLAYDPPCETVFVCETEPAVCGGSYCPLDYTCAVDYRKTCGGVAYDPGYVVEIVSKPFECEKPKFTYVIDPSAYAYADASAEALAFGGGYAYADANAEAKAVGGGYAYADADAEAKAVGGGYAYADADADATAISGGHGGYAIADADADAKAISGGYGGYAIADADAKAKALAGDYGVAYADADAKAKALAGDGGYAIADADAKAKALAGDGGYAIADSDAKAAAKTGDYGLAYADADAESLAKAGDGGLAIADSDAKSYAEAGHGGAAIADADAKSQAETGEGGVAIADADADAKAVAGEGGLAKADADADAKAVAGEGGLAKADASASATAVSGRR